MNRRAFIRQMGTVAAATVAVAAVPMSLLQWLPTPCASPATKLPDLATIADAWAQDVFLAYKKNIVFSRLQPGLSGQVIRVNTGATALEWGPV